LEVLEERQLLSATPVTAAVVRQLASGLYARDGQITRADARMLFDVVDGTDQVAVDGRRIAVTTGVDPAARGTVSAEALRELDAIFASPAAWGISANVQGLGEEVLQSVKAGDSDSVMRQAVDTAFHITSQGSTTGNQDQPPSIQAWNQVLNTQV
jgi:hypothetical protein